MRAVKMVAMLGVVTGLVGCAAVPDKSELQRIDRAEIESKLLGNTMTYSTDYGRWAEYHASPSTGYGRAWGNWGSESAAMRSVIGDDGKLCETFSGPHDWSTSDHEYCSVFYSDAEGNLYEEITRNTYKPSRVGQLKKVEIKAGDAYGLSE